MTQDEIFMQRALELAAKGQGAVEPNPMVGAVVVRKGRIVGEGYHRRFGAPHAEIIALRAARRRARRATLYVNLEPCGHEGKTPPCSEAIIAAGIGEVVYASGDPNPATRGKGPGRLRAARIKVRSGVRRSEARRLNAPYFKLTKMGMPYVIAKWAMTLDGKIGTRTGSSRWVSDPLSREVTHELRGRVDAVMVGIGTVLKDDPELTCRTKAIRQPARVIVDTHARLPLESRLIGTLGKADVIVACTSAASATRYRSLERAGCVILHAREKEGRVSLRDLLRQLGHRGFTNVMIEGGGRLLGSAFDRELVDEVCVFLAPKIVGGLEAESPVEGTGVTGMRDALGLDDVEIQPIGKDVMIRARVKDSLFYHGFSL